MTYPLGAFHDMQMITDHFTEGRIMTDDEMRERYSKRPIHTPAVEAENRRLHAGPPPTFYTTPPDFKKCMNYQEHGPTPCWHPHCNCFETPKDWYRGPPRDDLLSPRRDWARDWPPHSYPDPWKSSRSDVIASVIGLVLVLGGFALLASNYFGYFR